MIFQGAASNDMEADATDAGSRLERTPSAHTEQPAAVRRIKWLHSSVLHPHTPAQYIICLLFWVVLIGGPIVLLVYWPKVVDKAITPALEVRHCL